MRLVTIAAAALAASACMTPRSLMLGQTAQGLGRGSAEIGVATGVGYANQISPPVNSTDLMGNPQSVSRGANAWVVPAFEGNVAFGLNDHVAIDAHFSSAGIQPGLKVTVNPKSAAQIAVLPEFALGYGVYSDAMYVAGADGQQRVTQPTSTTSFTGMLGLRFLVSHDIGFYGAIGYDFIGTRSVVTGTQGQGSAAVTFQTLTTTIQHSISVNLGWSVAVSWIRIRPEIAFAVQPSISSHFSNGGSDVASYGGFGWCILPGFSLAAVTPKVKKDDEEEEKAPPSEEEEKPEENRE